MSNENEQWLILITINHKTEDRSEKDIVFYLVAFLEC